MEQITVPFLNKSFEQSEWLLSNNFININEIKAFDYHIIIGIPMITTLECVMRSANDHDNTNNYILLVTGVKIKPEITSGSDDVMEIICNLQKAIIEYKSLNVTSDEYSILAKQLISKLRDDEDVDIKYRKLYSILYGIVLDMTKNTEYKTKFNNILTLLIEMYSK